MLLSTVWSYLQLYLQFTIVKTKHKLLLSTPLSTEFTRRGLQCLPARLPTLAATRSCSPRAIYAVLAVEALSHIITIGAVEEEVLPQRAGRLKRLKWRRRSRLAYTTPTR